MCHTPQWTLYQFLPSGSCLGFALTSSHKRQQTVSWHILSFSSCCWFWSLWQHEVTKIVVFLKLALFPLVAIFSDILFLLTTLLYFILLHGRTESHRMYVHILFIHSSLVGHLSFLCNLATWTEVQLTLMCRYLHDVLFWRLLGKSWEVAKLARIVGLPWGTSILISIVAGLASFPTQCSGFLWSAPQLQLLWFAVLIAAFLTVVRWNLHVVSLCISSVDNVLVLFLVTEIRDPDDSNLREQGCSIKEQEAASRSPAPSRLAS